MKMNDKKTLREKTAADLHTQMESLRKELAVTKMQFGVGKLGKTHLFKHIRLQIAVIQTILTEKENTAA